MSKKNKAKDNNNQNNQKKNNQNSNNNQEIAQELDIQVISENNKKAKRNRNN